MQMAMNYLSAQILPGAVYYRISLKRSQGRFDCECNVGVFGTECVNIFGGNTYVRSRFLKAKWSLFWLRNLAMTMHGWLAVGPCHPNVAHQQSLTTGFNFNKRLP